jgi:hypothetical protein
LGFQIADRFFPLDPSENFPCLFALFCRYYLRNRMPDNLILRITIEPFRCPVPADDDTAGVLSNNRIAWGFDNGGE